MEKVEEKIGLWERGSRLKKKMGLGFKPYKQPPRRMILDIINRVKEKIKWLLDGGFIGPTLGFLKDMNVIKIII